ncbi:MAG TPA: tyrosine-type recombinase/integrase [Edaphobacter sp.]|nr:tyrosine-type recombinase/integrase [Edaphobacter sp.]
MRHKRTRYQHGSLTIEKRKTGPDVWVYRWREGNVRRKQIIGSTEQYATRAAALRAIDGLRLDINAVTVSNSPVTIRELFEHYTLIELADEASKTQRTKRVYKQHLDTHVIPKWGDHRIGGIKPFAVEAWLKSLPYAPATKAKTRNILSALYQHAVRYGWAESNPIRAVRQSSKRLREPDVLRAEEVSALLRELSEPSRTIALVAVTTGLRRGELFGLKWGDVDFEKRKVHIVRSIVDQVAGEPKTVGSKRPLPIPEQVAASLQEWRKAAEYNGDDDWVFASDHHLGKTPLWPNTVLVRHIKPAAERAEITKNIGWHTFRRTFATLLESSGAGLKTLQELMRHSTPTVTLGLYVQGVTQDKRNAQDKVTKLFKLPASA